MPSGIILTMLVDEKLPDYERDDECFYYLINAINTRLHNHSMEVNNRADDSLLTTEKLTESDNDADIRELRNRTDEALQKLQVLHEHDCTPEQAKKVWDWVFKSDGFFDDDDSGGNDGGGESSDGPFGIASSTPKKAVDPRGGGRFG